MGVKWIKIATDIFDNRKIRQIENMPDADSILVIWFKILALAGTINESGMLMITKEIPYTDEMLANQFNRPLNTVRMALNVFEQFGMISIVDNIILLSNWEKYQSNDRLQEIKEQNRLRQKRWYDKNKQKTLGEPNVRPNANITQPNATDIEEDKEREREKEIDIEREKEREGEREKDMEQIKDLFNETCVSYPSIRSLSNNRIKEIAERFKEGFSIEDFKEAFISAEKSEFLKGNNKKGWQASFDWLIKSENLIKTLEGNYNDKIPTVKAEPVKPTDNPFLNIALEEENEI